MIGVDPQLILGALIFSTFAIDPTLVQNRLQISATILLSNITFKLAVSHTLPHVSYFTYLVSGLQTQHISHLTHHVSYADRETSGDLQCIDYSLRALDEIPDIFAQ